MVFLCIVELLQMMKPSSQAKYLPKPAAPVENPSLDGISDPEPEPEDDFDEPPTQGGLFSLMDVLEAEANDDGDDDIIMVTDDDIVVITSDQANEDENPSKRRRTC